MEPSTPLTEERPVGDRINISDRASSCARLAILLRRSLRGLDWDGMSAEGRDRLESAMTDLGADIPLLWLIRGQTDLPERQKPRPPRARPARGASRRTVAQPSPATRRPLAGESLPRFGRAGAPDNHSVGLSAGQ